MSHPTSSLPPGFRFHPTDEELIFHYLRNRAASSPCPVHIIAEVDIYKFDPWDLPAKAMFGDQEWYFFSLRDRKYPNGVRPNRAAASGYWKATGTDKPIVRSNGNENIGVKKALVFYKGKPPKGSKTNWIMHEYRLSGNPNTSSIKPMKRRNSSMRLDDWVLCRIYQKSSHHLSPMEHPEEEDSIEEDTHLSNLTNTTQQSNLKLHKSFSLSELLDEADYSLLYGLIENPIEMAELEQGSFSYPCLNQSFIDNSNGYSTHQFSQTEPSVPLAENTMKRQRMVDGCLEGGGLLHPSKRQNSSWVYPNLVNQFNNDLSFLNQQLPLNSQLGLH